MGMVQRGVSRAVRREFPFDVPESMCPNRCTHPPTASTFQSAFDLDEAIRRRTPV
jgi:hypothetical protein